MERIRFVMHRGTPVLLVDLTDFTDFAEMRRQIDAEKALIATQPPKSLLVLTDVTGSRYNPEMVGVMKDLGAHNNPYIRAGALVTQAAAHRLAARTFALLNRRPLKTFATRDEAFDWLVAQA